MQVIRVSGRRDAGRVAGRPRAGLPDADRRVADPTGHPGAGHWGDLRGAGDRIGNPTQVGTGADLLPLVDRDAEGTSARRPGAAAGRCAGGRKTGTAADHPDAVDVA